MEGEAGQLAAAVEAELGHVDGADAELQDAQLDELQDVEGDQQGVAEAEPERLEPLRIERAIVIRGGHLKAPWVPNVEEVQGVPYIQLSKWSRDLTRYVSGKGMNLRVKGGRPLHNINVAWFAEMVKLRRAACDATLKSVITSAAVDAGQDPPTKFRQATDDDQWLCGRSVLLDAPAVAEHVPGRQLRVLWAIKSTELWMELTLENLEYVKWAIATSSAVQRPKKVQSEGQTEDQPGGKRRRRRAAERGCAEG